jgi:hypothetical protein
MTAFDARFVGVLGGGRLTAVDRAGTVRPERANWDLAWWIGADDRWHFPDREAAVRQSLLDGMPVVVTAMRVPGGDAIHRVYGGGPDATVVEVENDSPAPFVVALVVRGAGHVELEGSTVVADRRVALVSPRPPARWAVSIDGSTQATVEAGGARDDAFVPRIDRGARLDAAFLFPLAHRARAQFFVPVGRGEPPKTAPDADQVARGWRAQLERGMRVELPDPGLQAAVETARAAVLLVGEAWITRPEVVIALEDWGFDDEARAAWKHLGLFARRKAARRPATRATWDEVHTRSHARDDAAFLAALRSALVVDRDDGVELLADWPDEWRGQPLDVRDAPTRAGSVSYSLRWHGDRVALLWEAPPGTTLRIPAFDPGWVGTTPRGEALLG